MNGDTQIQQWDFQVRKSIICDSSLSPEARLLYVILRSFEGKHGEPAFPKLTTLAAILCRQRAFVQKKLRELEAVGLIHTRNTSSKEHRFGPNRYTTTIPEQYVSQTTERQTSLGQTTVKRATKNKQGKEFTNGEEIIEKERVDESNLISPLPEQRILTPEEREESNRRVEAMRRLIYDDTSSVL